MVLYAKIWALGVLVVIGVLLFLGPLRMELELYSFYSYYNYFCIYLSVSVVS